MPTIALYRRIASFSYDEPDKAADILAVSFETAEGSLRASYTVGRAKIAVVAGLIIVCVAWAIIEAWLFLPVGIALAFKLRCLVRKAGKDKEIMLGYRELRLKGIDYNV